MTETPKALAPPVIPLSRSDLKRIQRRPLQAMDVLLAQRDRVIASVVDGKEWGLVLRIMLFVSLGFALPYGLIENPSRIGHISLLFLGSVLLCLPALHVFSVYMGVSISVMQSSALALWVSAVAALFTFAFAPIVWFLGLTMGDSDGITVSGISMAFLFVSLVAGMSQLMRCTDALKREGMTVSVPLLIAWQVLLTFIWFRMALLLELL